MDMKTNDRKRKDGNNAAAVGQSTQAELAEGRCVKRAKTATRNPRARTLHERLIIELERMSHEFLPIGEVCALRGVSKSWQHRIGGALQKFSWHAQHRTGFDCEAHLWLDGLAKANVRVRSLDLEFPHKALTDAALTGSLGATRLIATHYQRDVDKCSPHAALHKAAEGGHVEVCRYLVETVGANVSVRDSLGNTPLHWAAFYGHLPAVQYLATDPAANANSRNASRETPLHIAAKEGRVAVVEFLTSLAEVDVTAQDRSDSTPLHYAAMCDHLTTVQSLISEPGIDVNAADHAGMTALHWAALCGNLEVVQCLVASPGVNVNAADSRNRTPLQHAVSRDDLNVAEFLEALPEVHGNL